MNAFQWKIKMDFVTLLKACLRWFMLRQTDYWLANYESGPNKGARSIKWK